MGSILLRFIVLGLKSLPYMIFAINKCNYMMRHSDKYSEMDKYRYIQRIVNILRRNSRTKTIAYGTENIPEEGPYLLFPNHQGKYDGFGVVITHKNPVSIIMEKTKAEMIVAKEMLPLVKGRAIDLENPRQQIITLNNVIEDIKDGMNYMMFPEGGYEDNKNQVQPFRTGVFKCAYETKVPVIPIALIDSYKAMNGNSLKKVTTQVHYLEPIYYEEYGFMKRKDFANMVRERIQAVIDANEN